MSMTAVSTAGSIVASARRRRIPFFVGIAIMAAFLLFSLFPGFFAPYDPLKFDYTLLSHPPSLAHPFGTDNFGRDVLSRVIWATRVDMQIALFCTIFPLIFGTIVGALTG